MKYPKHVITAVIALSIAAIPGWAQIANNNSNQRKPANRLSLSIAQRLLNEQVNQTTVNNTLLTSRACYDSDDKADNDRALVVSTFSMAMEQFLTEHGYIRSSSGQNVFTAKAKRSKYYAYNDGTPGFRLAIFRNPRILSRTIVDPQHVPVEYQLVPTELTASVLGAARHMRTTVRFTYEDGAWDVCMTCR